MAALAAVLGPCAGGRHRVVPGTTAVQGRERGSIAGRCDALGQDANRPSPAPAGRLDLPPVREEPAIRPRRLAWADLLRRVFAVDVLACPRCGGRMRLLAAIQPPRVTQAILDCLALPSRAPPTAAAVLDLGTEEEWPGDSQATL